MHAKSLHNMWNKKNKKFTTPYRSDYSWMEAENPFPIKLNYLSGFCLIYPPLFF